MAYTRDELISLSGSRDISGLREKIVGINIFDNVGNVKLSDTVLRQNDFTIEIYQDYINSIKDLADLTAIQNLLNSLKRTEIVDNHCLEKENRDLLLGYQQTHHSSAISYLIKRIGEDMSSPLNSRNIIKAHEILMRGTSNEDEILINVRKNNNFYVGYVDDDGKKVIQYFPISFDEIRQAMQLFLEYFNSQEQSVDNLFLKPFNIHALLAALQLFEDGNTRLARTMQHVSLFQNTIGSLGESFNLPILYFSNTYIPYRKEYRDLLMNIAVNPNDENWNNWYLFNLRRAQDQLFANEEALKRVRK